jgi:hypothetical protein
MIPVTSTGRPSMIDAVSIGQTRLAAAIILSARLGRFSGFNSYK